MAYVDRECALVTLDRTSPTNGIFRPTDNDDRRYAKWLVENGYFEASMQRQLSGRNMTVYRLTEAGRAVWQSRREMRMETFRAIAKKRAEYDAL